MYIYILLKTLWIFVTFLLWLNVESFAYKSLVCCASQNNKLNYIFFLSTVKFYFIYILQAISYCHIVLPLTITPLQFDFILTVHFHALYVLCLYKASFFFFFFFGDCFYIVLLWLWVKQVVILKRVCMVDGNIK